MIFITSDLHFSHKKILELFPNTRRFNTIEEHDQHLLSTLNALKEQKGFETLYHLGDFFLGKNRDLEYILDSIQIPITFVFGNHDHSYFRKKIESYPNFKGVDYLELKYNGNKLCMFHYPMTEWNGSFRGSLHFHGHLHGTENPFRRPNSLDVGWDAHGEILSLDEAITKVNIPMTPNVNSKL